MGLMERLERQRTTTQRKETVQETSHAQAQAPAEDYTDLRAKVHNEVIDTMNTRKASLNRMQSQQLRDELLVIIESIVDREGGNIPRADRLRLSREICDEVAGLGPLEPLLEDASVTEIMVNGPNRVYVEKAGKLELSEAHFRDTNHVMNVIDRIVTTIGRRIDESSPMVDARLPDGSRVNAVIPPLSLIGPVITIRKFSRKPFTPQDLIRFGSLTPKMMAFLDACVKGRLNIIVSGGTGSGKTTLLNVLSGFIPEDERIVTIEDAAELQLRQQHVVIMESRPPNIEGKGQITIRDLVRNALRMRPDRIVVGEVRSGETLDMLQAMNTGHDGSITTAHANNSRDLISRLETMVLMAGMELPLKAIREQIASALDLVVQQARMRDGSRKITSITEVVGMEGDVITLQDIFTYEAEGVDSMGKFRGEFRATGIRPQFSEKLRNNGVGLRDEWFQN
jgi:pilus assembly protein CpaF